jgi:hypothetical protein
MDSVANVSDLETELNSTLASDLISANLTAEELRTDMRNSSTTDDGDLAKELIAAEKSVQSSFSSTTMATLKLFAVPQKDAMNPVCEHATITAITLMPYEDTLIGMDLDRLHQQIKLYEAYTQRKLSSFGEYSEEAT